MPTRNGRTFPVRPARPVSAHRRRVPPAPYSREEVFAAWGHRCIYCDDPADEIEHLTPISLGGSDTRPNVAPACTPCNHSRGNKTWLEWVLSWPTTSNPTPS